MNRGLPTVALLAAILISHAVLPAAADQELRSSGLTKELAGLMTARQMDAVAAADPQTPGRFVAAMFFPGVQMLVIAARHPAPTQVQPYLDYKRYGDVYALLQEPSLNDSKVFIQDLGCDGLQAQDGTADVMYERGTTQTLFDANWKKRGISETVFQQKLHDADTEYSRMLSVLIGALKPATGTGSILDAPR